MASLRARAFFAVLLFAAILPLAGASNPPVFSFKDLPLASDRPIVVLPPLGEVGLAYRFILPDSPGQTGPWLEFSRPVELGASLGEERTYVLESRDGRGLVSRRTVVIDRKAPGLPLATEASGLYRKDLRLGLASQEEGQIRYSLAPAGDASQPVFVDYSPTDGIVLGLPAQGSETWRLLAYVVDRVGNPGPVLSQMYRLAPEGLDFSAPGTIAELDFGPSSLAELPDPRETRLGSSLSLGFEPPQGQNLLVAINPRGEIPSREDFVYPGGRGGKTLELSWPQGWKGKAFVYIALEQDGKLLYRPRPLELILDSEIAVLAPIAPSVTALGEGRPSLVRFPPYDGLVFASLNGGAFLAVSDPLSIAPSPSSIILSWYGQDWLGRKSAMQKLELDIPEALGATSILGLPQGGLAAKPIVLSSSGPGYLRYELSLDPQKPPREPSASSSILGQGLRLDPPEGATTRYLIRYRSFDSAGQAIDEGGTADFVIDREAPPPPRLVQDLPAYSSRPLGLAWAESDSTIMVAVDVDSRQGSFAPIATPILLEGSTTGAVEYRIHAYAVDKAGNRSAESPVRSVLVDLATLYVAETGPATGDGSRDSPFPNLDAALAGLKESQEGHRTLHLQGTLVLSSIRVLEGLDLTIEGGYGSDWKRVPGLSSAIHVNADASPILSLRKTSLNLSSVSIRAPRLGGALFDLEASELQIVSSSILASSGGDLLLIDARDSRIGLSSCEVFLGEGGSVSVIAAKNSRIDLEGSSLTGSGASYFSALSLEGGELNLRACSLSSTALLGTRLMELKRTKVDIDRTLWEVQGGGGFLSFGSFEACVGRVVNSHLLLDWEGSGSLFRIKGGRMSFLHDSFYGITRKGSLRFFDADGPNLVLQNSILAAKGEANILLSSPGLPNPGDLASNSLWGFKTLVSGSRSLVDPISLNDYNAKVAVPGLKSNFVEDPFLTWGANPPGAFMLQDSSRCVDGALVVPGLGLDYSGQSRPSGSGPDVGADELQR